MKSPDPLESAIQMLGIRRTVRHGERAITLACLVREEDWRPLKAPWWRGKDACVLGVDLAGNFLLRHCDGSIRFWDHQLQQDIWIAGSVRDLVLRIE